MSNQDIVPGNAGEAPHHQRRMRWGVLEAGVSVSTLASCCGMALKAPLGVWQEASGPRCQDRQSHHPGTTNANLWSSGTGPSCICPSREGRSAHLR